MLWFDIYRTVAFLSFGRKKLFSFSDSLILLPENPAKLAPIFTKKQAVLTEVAPKTALDPELVRQRQDFLRSSLPDNLKKRNGASVAACCLQRPPIPRRSHVQQVPAGQDAAGLNAWALPTVDLKLRDEPSGIAYLGASEKMSGMTMSAVKWEALAIPKVRVLGG